MFKNLKNRLRKRRLANIALLKTNDYLNYLFTSDEAYEKYPSVRVLKKKGEKTIKDFRKYIIQTILEIVQSNNPVTAMYKTLISNVQSDCMNRLLWTEEFHSRRQEIYNVLNKNIYNTDALTTDELTVSMAMWTEAESICLRLLQGDMFEEISEEDWWTDYVKLYEEYVKNLYRSILDKADGNEPPLYTQLLKANMDILNDYERKIIEGAEKIKLWE